MMCKEVHAGAPVDLKAVAGVNEVRAPPICFLHAEQLDFRHTMRAPMHYMVECSSGRFRPEVRQVG